MTIKILSNKTINKISAGEVIERPASAVKEIVENAVDAGATKIDIRLEQAGKNLIQVSDNGKGMSKDELELAIQRHATSKLDEDDLLNINSFGFRGEALPSIGAVSRLKITSCQDGEDIAHEICVEGGEVSETRKAARPTGTTVEIRDLFFATPARLKFLRTDRTELNAIASIVKRIALGNPDVEFTLTHEGKEMIRARCGASEDRLEQRVRDIISNDFIENACTVSFQAYVNIGEKDSTEEHNSEPVEVKGYTSLPTYNRATSEEQYLFINNRPVKDKILQIALKTAYQDFMARDRFPVTALFLKIPPRYVDVNVHPAKTEVRFYDPNGIRSLVSNAIKDAVNSAGHRTSTTVASQAFSYAKPEAPARPSSAMSEHEATRNSAFAMPRAGGSSSSNFSPSRGAPTPRYDYAAATAQTSIGEVTTAPPVARQETPMLDDAHAESHPLGAAKAQLHETYIVAQNQDSIVIVDQHAAHERLGYEKIKEQMEKNGLAKQRLLIPEIIELPSKEHAEALAGHSQELERLGLTIQNFGEKSVIVNEVPSLIGEVDLGKLINDLADHLLESGANIALTELIEHITETYACHYAIRAGRKLNIQEMNELLRQMENTPFSGQCNHGRPTYVKLDLKDVEKLFGRR